MASPVDTSVKWFSSKMAGAPIRNATAGSYVSGLDACLITGWGVQTASSVVVSGGVCTATFPFTHAALIHSVVLVAGASKSELNGEQKVTSTGTNTVSWATDAANGTDTGTVTVKMAPLGFSKVFSGTNLAVYKSTDPRSKGHFLRVSDTGSTEARVIGYENMTAVSTGTGPFPTSAQQSGGGGWGKGFAADSKAVPWFLAGDSMLFYSGSCAYQSHAGVGDEYATSTFDYFGDPLSHASGVDAFNTVLTAGLGLGTNWGNYGSRWAVGGSMGAPSVYSPRAQSGVGTSVPHDVAPYISSLAAGPISASAGRMHLVPVFVKPLATGVPREDLPGVLVSPQEFWHPMPAAGLPIRIGDSPDSDRLMVYVSNDFSLTGGFTPVCIDIIGPWRV